MSPEEIAESEDVGELFSQLKAAKAFNDTARVRLLEARMRDLAGANTKADGRGKRTSVDDATQARLRAKSISWETGGA